MSCLNYPYAPAPTSTRASTHLRWHYDDFPPAYIEARRVSVTPMATARQGGYFKYYAGAKMTDEEIITIYEKNRGLIITALRATGLMGFNTNTPQSQELISVGKMCFLQALYRYSARQPKVSLATYLYKSVKWGACRYMRRHQALMRSGPIAKSGTHKYLLSLDASASNDFEVGLLVDLIADDNTPLPCDNVASDYDMLFDQLHKCAAELPPRQRAVIESIINNDDCPCGPNLKGSHLQHIRRSSRPAVKKIKQLLMEYRNAKLTA